MSRVPAIPRPSAQSIRSTVFAAQNALRRAGHKPCAMNPSRHQMLIEEVDKLYQVAAWLDQESAT